MSMLLRDRNSRGSFHFSQGRQKPLPPPPRSEIGLAPRTYPACADYHFLNATTSPIRRSHRFAHYEVSMTCEEFQASTSGLLMTPRHSSLSIAMAAPIAHLLRIRPPPPPPPP